MRITVQQLLGTVPYLYLSFALVATTMAVILGLQWYLIVRQGDAAHRSTRAVGYSCVLFALITMASVLQEEFCPIPFFSSFCFKTWQIPLPLGLSALPVNAAPFALLLAIQVSLLATTTYHLCVELQYKGDLCL